VAQIRLNPIVSQNVVTYATVIAVPNPELKLKLGMTAVVTIEIARRTNVLRVPNGALRYRPDADIFADLKLPVPAEFQRADEGRSGQTPDAGGGARTQTTPVQGEASIGRVQADAGSGRNTVGLAAVAATKPGARTIDQLFGALLRPPTRGRTWIYMGGQLKPVQVRMGITDGTWTELLSQELGEGQQLVFNIVTPAMAAAARLPPNQRPGQQGRNANPFQGGGAGGHGH
jgi:HlyD family secretion protein